MIKQTLAVLAVTSLLATPVWAEEGGKTLQQVLAGEQRSAANKARDVFRHPAATLDFFEVKPHMTVVEIFPGGGWYTEILAPYVKGQGKLYAAGFDPASASWAAKSVTRFNKKIAAGPEFYNELEVTVLNPPSQVDIAPAGSADRVLTFRNVHNWMKAGTENDVFSAMFRALKPGGILGVVEHRGDEAVPQDPKSKSGYVNQDYVVALAKQAGFELLASSEINANPRDTKNHPKGVWSLPPSLKGGEENQAAYLAIGESDRMTLKFIKP